ncbi:hypothetical protein M2281_005434 [Mesorhizobium soli]|nr:hypothetical protein [Mesorhizobium soli]
MKHLFASLAIGTCLVLLLTEAASATGQPGASAGVACTVSPDALLTPGKAGTASNPAGTNGAAFNESLVKGYAGNPGNPTTTNGASANAVSQYDIACKNVSQMP